MTDTQLLDYLDSLTVPAGYGWQLRPSTTGRGWRLHTTTLTPNYPTARQAIELGVVSYVCAYENDPGETFGMWAGPVFGLEGLEALLSKVPDPEDPFISVIARVSSNCREVVYRWSDEACKWEPTDAL